MDKKELPFLTASQLSRLIETKEVSPVEATEAYLDRIQEIDPKLNSYITVTGEQALESARQAEQEIATGRYRGPLHGVPMAVKDQFNTAGILTTGGSSILKDNIPDEDATVITNLKKAGAVMLGKLNMSEFAMAEIYNHPYGTPRNPWDLERNPGTSSSGSGAATAASLCATSLGEDTGGSIRGPANFSGLVGLRPSYGRVSRYGVLGGSWSMDTVGPISRSVEDAAITIQAIAGYDPKDSYSWNVPVPDYRQALTGDVQGIRLGVVQERMDSPNLDSEFRDTVAKAISVLGELGASSEDVSIPLAPHAGALTMSILSVEWSNLHRPLFEPNIDELDHNNKIRFLTGSIIPAQFYYKAQKIRAVLRQQILNALDKVDVLVLPTGPVTAPLVESVPGIESKEHALT
ncbi:MAG: Asp-tRNA(Asn)/Glu-tRNA(Gln) amidotransferase GatCAB subunit A, partial [Chloroflexi bacterium]|nr:Asp-tRNA(Asn)/Glu-tRNA(Gln) amidotransferase GatCAB subunit A [Chloroflexota bacterium]